MVNDVINEQPTCALFFVKPPTCAALANCVEPAIWCWHESCPYSVPADPCIVNESTIYYCSCSAIPPSLSINVAGSESPSSSDYLQPLTTTAMSSSSLPAGAVATIVILSLLITIGVVILCVWIFIKYKRRRKLEGRYCPAVEEEKCAVKTLPPLPPPSIEGLI